MTIGGRLTLVRSMAIRTVALLVIVGSLVASPKGIMLAWGVLYPDVEGAGSAEIFDAIVVLSGEDRRIERGLKLAMAGKAPLPVAINGRMWSRTRSVYDTISRFETVCPTPPEESTRGEARLIGRLVQDYEWKEFVVISGDYHVGTA